MDNTPRDMSFVEGRWDRMRIPAYQHDFLTSHLPTAVVGTDVTVLIGHFTDPANPRGGVTLTGITLGDRQNPPLTADEADYVVAVLLDAARFYWRTYGDERDS
jgi:hypothetical protein